MFNPFTCIMYFKLFLCLLEGLFRGDFFAGAFAFFSALLRLLL